METNLLMRSIVIITLLYSVHRRRICSVNAFSGVLFQEKPTLRHSAPSKTCGIDIELPDFDELFGRIQVVSPLAKSVIENEHRSNLGAPQGFDAIYDKTDYLKWKTIEYNKRKSLHTIQKIENFNNLQCPILRFRASLTGPCIGEAFANFIMDLDARRKWDAQIDYVKETYPMNDLDYANIAMGFGKKYGDCRKLGVGYCRTKANLGISPREQLTICGIQDFHSSRSCLIWGVEMEEWQNHLFPSEFERTTRAKSHIFSTVLTPTSENTFDVEYALQLEIGGKLPTWLTTPIMLDSIKGMFHLADSFFQNKNGELEKYLAKRSREDDLIGRQAILMTP